MNHLMISELDQNKKRLEYYQHVKSRWMANLVAKPSRAPKETPADKWIDIYAERVRKLERQVLKLGLKSPGASR